MLQLKHSRVVMRLGVLTIATVMALVAGCASQPPPQVDNGLTVRIKVGENLNPNGVGRPSPVFVRIYQLRDKTEFVDATYGDLAANDKAVLGESLLARRDVEVCPVAEGASTAASPGCKGKAVIQFQLDRITRADYVAVVAEFYHLHDPQGNWRTVTALAAGEVPVVVIDLHDSSVSAAFE